MRINQLTEIRNPRDNWDAARSLQRELDRTESTHNHIFLLNIKRVIKVLDHYEFF